MPRTDLPRLTLVQLPIPQPGAFTPTGNVPLAAGCLAVSARVHALDQRLAIGVVDTATTDRAGDAMLADQIASDAPDFLGLSLYLWNTERSLHLGREVKRRSPRTQVIIGGPEVGPDNPYVLGQSGFDIAVTGEAEDSFAALMACMVEGKDPRGLANVAVRDGDALTPFGPPANANFPLTRYPSPYRAGFVAVDPERSTYVETVRGCRSHCTFCFYPRSSAVLRVLDVPQSAQLITELRDSGAREVVFLDPTFNHRPEFEALLDELARVNADRRLTFFAEVRAEGLTARHADQLAKAGFTRLEIGLQSVNRDTLKKVRRGGNPDKVAAAAKLLHAAGIDVLVDLIIGLPGDRAADVAAGVDFLLEHDLGDDAQVFPLCVLPGTAMRTQAESDGLVFDSAPPYRIRATASMDEAALLDALRAAEERLARRLDEFPRPHLVADATSPRDVMRIDLDRGGDASPVGDPAARHVALWLAGTDLYAERDAITRLIAQRTAVDPYGTLDVVLAPRRTFPLELLLTVRSALDAGPASYASRILSHRGENSQRRVTVVLPEGAALPDDYLAALSAQVLVFEEQSLAVAAQRAPLLGNAQPGARVVGPLPPNADAAWRTLTTQADPEWIAFADRKLEERWVKDVLTYREIRPGTGTQRRNRTTAVPAPTSMP